MSCYFQMECRRWAPTCDVAGLSGLLLVILLDVGLTGWTWSTGTCRDAGTSQVAPELIRENGKLTASKDCGIRNTGTSPASGYDTEQPKPDGSTVYGREVTP